MRATVIADEEHLMQLNRQASKGLWTAAVIGVIAVIGCIDHSVTGPNHQNAAGLAVRLLLQDGNGQTGAVGAALATPITVKVLDANGLGVSGATVTFAVRKGSGSLSSPTAVSDTSGLAKTFWTMGTLPGTGSVTAILSTTSVLDSLVVSATAVAAAGASVVISAGDAQNGTVGQALATSLTAQTLDAYGNVAPGSPVAWTVVSGGGSVTVLNGTSDANGLSAARWTLGNISGTQVVRASVGSATVANFRAHAAAGNPVTMVADAGTAQSGTVGRALTVPLTVRVFDAYGNGVNNAAVNWSADDGSIAAIGSSTDSTGRMQARWTLGQRVGAQSALASLSSAPPVAFTATATAGAATTAVIETGNNQTFSVSSMMPLPLVVKVTDSFGNPVSGVPVNWSTTTGSGSLVVSNNTTDATGRSTALWTLGSVAGSMSALANVTGQPILQFNATGTLVPGVVDTLAIVTGNNQSGQSVTALPVPLVVRLVDNHGIPVSGKSIIYQVMTGNGTMSNAVAVTDANGQASSVWTLGSLFGVQTATATYGSRSVAFAATAKQKYKIRYQSGHTAGQIAGFQVDTTGATLGDTLVVQVYDPTDSSGVQGIQVDFTTQASDVVDGRAINAAVLTDKNGFAKNVWVLRSNTGVAIPPSTVSKRMIATAANIGQVEFQARAYAARWTSVSVTLAPVNLHADSSNTVAFKVTDSNGYAIAGATVSIAVSAGTALPLSGSTAADGSYSVAWKFGAASGAQTISITVTTFQTGPYIETIGPSTFVAAYGVNP